MLFAMPNNPIVSEWGECRKSYKGSVRSFGSDINSRNFWFDGFFPRFLARFFISRAALGVSIVSSHNTNTIVVVAAFRLPFL